MQDDDRSVKLAIIEWFLRHYEDPGQNTPYDSGEGGYLYQWGGPYNAREVLHAQFSVQGDEKFEKLLDEVAESLDSISLEWERIPTLEDIDPSSWASEYYTRCKHSLCCIRNELERLPEGLTDSFVCSLLFAHTITCLEAYLADAFLRCIKEKSFFRAFVESDPELRKEKLCVSEVFKKMESLEGDATKRIQSIIFHNLAVVQQMYRNTLGIELPAGMKDLCAAVNKRHDIVHRNCKSKDGRSFIVTEAEVAALVAVVEKFVTELDLLVEKGLK